MASIDQPSDLLKEEAFSQSSKDYNVSARFEERRTQWKSIWLVVLMQLHIGVQLSIYYVSMPLDKTASIDFVGIVVASASIGCSLTNPLFGFWNQRSLSVRSPVTVGNILMVIGQLAYGLLPVFGSNTKWIMLGVRFITGMGAGSMSVLRAYAATASTLADRSRAISLSTAGFALGFACGPAVQAAFSFMGAEGFQIGPVVFDMYTLPAFTMVVVALLSSVVMSAFFVSDYAGIVTKEERKADPDLVIPKHDMLAALVCIYLWMVSRSVTTTAEVIATPVTMAFYDWNNEKAIFSNGLLFTACLVVIVVFYLVVAYTRIGKIDARKHAVFSLLGFTLYYGSHLSWPFYTSPLHFIPKNENGTEDSSLAGGCYESYEWCKTAVRVPLPVYVISLLTFKGGAMQGFMAFGGSVAQFLMPLIATILFQHFGYQSVVLVMLGQIFIGFVLTSLFYRRLTPLKVTRSTPDTLRAIA